MLNKEEKRVIKKLIHSVAPAVRIRIGTEKREKGEILTLRELSSCVFVEMTYIASENGKKMYEIIDRALVDEDDPLWIFDFIDEEVERYL